MIRALTLAACVLTMGAGQADRYAVGQVWEYRTRPQDAGSLLKIQKIEPWADGRVYHLSLVGVSLGGVTTDVHHVPVSRETLDASVTRPSTSTRAFPDATEGIAIWREDRGGVFTIPVARIAQVIDDTLPDAAS